MPRSIDVVISKDGRSVSVETRGYVGKACQDATAALERALGRVTKDKKTSEFYRQQDTRLKHRV